MQNRQQSLPDNPVFTKKQDEKILVVKQTTLFPFGPVQGFCAVDITHYQEIIEREKEFLWRSAMEIDPAYKQIIPYLVFMHDEKIFLMRRKATAGDARLKNKYTLGIGGHIREEDMAGRTLADWAAREFAEEIDYEDSFDIRPLGLVNDESNDVGAVHTGFVFLLVGSSPHIAVRDELAEGMLVSFERCAAVYDAMETWSQLVFDTLVHDFF